MNEPDEHEALRAPSRRLWLRAAVAVTGTTLASLVAERARAQQKASKDAMKYQDKPNGDQRCGNCLHFQPPAGCAIVEGTISPNGYCIAWVKHP
jgi:hypothetical protein